MELELKGKEENEAKEMERERESEKERGKGGQADRETWRESVRVKKIKYNSFDCYYCITMHCAGVCRLSGKCTIFRWHLLGFTNSSSSYW